MARLTGGGLTGAAHLYAVVHGEAEQGHDDAEQCQKDPVLADARETVAPQEGDDAQQPRTPLCPCPRCQNYDRFFSGVANQIQRAIQKLEFFGRLMKGLFADECKWFI